MPTERRLRLGILTSHPIQYQAPLFRALAERCDLLVYFAHRATAADQAEAGFGAGFDWDTDLISGYRSEFLPNVAAKPSVVRFGGCDTPAVAGRIALGHHDAFVVFGWHLKSYLQAAWACRKLGVPLLARTDSHLEAPRSRIKRIAKTVLYPLFLRQFDAFLPAGTRAAEYLRHYRVPADRIHVVPYCIDVERFRAGGQQASAQREALRAQWGVAPGELALLYVGKMIDCKRPGDLLEAVARLRASGTAARAVFVGTGPLEAQLRSRAAELGDVATFAGFTNQGAMPSCYAAADLLVLPSESETWGMVVNEAFACGLPVVASTAVGSAPDLIDEGSTGALHAPGDIAGLTSAIRRMAGCRERPEVAAALEAKTLQYSPAGAAEALAKAARAAISTIRSQAGPNDATG